MAAKLTSLTYKIAIQLHLVAESSTICSSRFRRPVRKLLDTPSLVQDSNRTCFHVTLFDRAKNTKTRTGFKETVIRSE